MKNDEQRMSHGKQRRPPRFRVQHSCFRSSITTTETTAVQNSVVNRADPLATRSAGAKCASRSEGSALPFGRMHAEMSQSLKDHGSPNVETFS